MKCTLCGCDINDISITLDLNINSSRKTESGTFEEIPNMSQKSNEVLCKKCFDKFAESLSTAMKR